MTKTQRLSYSFAATAVVALLTAGPVGADDRDFVRTSVEEPYVFLLFDVSGSMNWTTQCTAAQFAAGDCRQICAAGDCYAEMAGDDPASKFYQSKEALYEVLSTVENVHFGFATFNQDDLFVENKSWMYEAISPGVALDDGSTFPGVGWRDVFAEPFPTCSTGSGDSRVGCFGTSADAADLTDAWERGRIAHFPKLGNGSTGLADRTVTFFILKGGKRYRVTYHPKTAAGLFYRLGDPTIVVDVEIVECTNNSCSSTSAQGRGDVTFRREGEFFAWEGGVNRNQRTRGYFPQIYNNWLFGTDHYASGTCDGWDPNDDSASDLPFGNNYNLRYGTTNQNDPRDPTRVGQDNNRFSYGDVIPLDWNSDNKQAVLDRLAPDGSSFDQSSYFEDHRQAGEFYLRLKNQSQKPMIAYGSTPLGNSIKDFRTWFAGCSQGSCPNATGWRDIAATSDPDWGCRKKYLIVLTDGDETCGGGNSACSGTASLRAQEGITTFVVAFGVQGGGNTLTCMAANGGSGDPIFPQNKQELVDALTAIFNQIKEETRSFASAAVPSVEANVQDKIFLSDFTPVAGAAFWDGHLDSFLKPLPVDAAGLPDRTVTCDANTKAGCFLWDAGAELLEQAPDAAEIGSGILRLGGADDERRLLFARDDFSLSLFQPQSNGPDWNDLFVGFGFEDALVPGEFGNNRDRATAIIHEVLVEKNATIEDVDGNAINITYVMGDVFHSDPVVVDTGDDFDRFAKDLFGEAKDCDLSANSDRGYRCFAFKQQFRRKMLLVGANDGQLHAIDAGTAESVVENGETRYEFNNGTGRELFGYIPRMALPILRDQSEGTRHIYGIDGLITVDDVYIEPAIGGTTTPDPDERQWRTIAVGGMREGGRPLGTSFVRQPEFGAAGSDRHHNGYFALDITQPDPLSIETNSAGSVFVPTTSAPVPGCWSASGVAPAGCGPLPFPAVLWEFTDRHPSGAYADEDANGFPDLGDTWGRPVVARVRVVESGTVVDKFVVIAAGGVDPNQKTSTDPRFGNFVYIIDIESGRAIYKREVLGSVPAIAALDASNDGIADTVYFGTTAGRIYKIDLSSPGTLVDTAVRDEFGVMSNVPRIVSPDWDPFVIFRTGNDMPVYQQIQILFVSRLGKFALTFGTGDREDLWTFNSIPGRFYAFVDDSFQNGDAFLPVVEDNLQLVTETSASIGANLFLNPAASNAVALPKQRGWYMRLGENEKVITKPFGVSNLLFFSSFVPEIVIEAGVGGPGGGPGGGGNANNDPACLRTGRSKNFLTFAFNGDPVADLDDDAATGIAGSGILAGQSGLDRQFLVADFVTNPFVEQTQTKNVNTSTDGGGGGGGEVAFEGTPTAQDCRDDARLNAVAGVLRETGPSNARYGNYYLRIGQRLSQRGMFYPACVPIAVMSRNWKDN